MVSQRPLQSVFAHIEQARRERKLSNGVLVAIGVSILLHLAGLAWLYQQRAHPAPSDISDGPVTTVTPAIVDLRPKPPPTERVRPPPPVPVHRPAPTPIDPVEISPILTEPPRPLLDDSRPEILPTTPAPTEPTAPQAPVVRPAAPPAPPMIREPNWVKQPSASQLSQYYPPRALELGRGGLAVLSCTVSASGTVGACRVTSESPAGFGFGDAGLKLTRYFQMSPRTEDGTPVEGGSVTIPIRFSTD